MKSSEIIQLPGDFALENGDHLVKPEISYTTHGSVNERSDNIVVVCHALTANAHVDDWWEKIFGPGKLLDPEKYFIICFNNLGSPYGTTSPDSTNPESGKRYGHNFPLFTIRDTARLHIAALNYLEIDQVHLLMGGSCGGNIAMEMAMAMGSRVHHLIVMCCSQKETSWVIAIHEAQRVALEADPTFKNNDAAAGQNGLRAARAFALTYYRSHPLFCRVQADDDDTIQNFRASSYIRYQGEKFIKRFDAHCYYKLLTALDTHNVARGYTDAAEALGQIKAKTLAIGFTTDLLIPIDEQRQLASLIPHAEFSQIDTDFGHDAFLVEGEKIMKAIRTWQPNL